MAQEHDNDVSIYFQEDYLVTAVNSLDILYQTNSAHNAIQWAVKHVGQKGGEVQLQSGIYTIGVEISLPSNVILSGQGPSTALKFENKSGSAISILNGEQVTVKNLALMSTSRGNTIGISLINAVKCSIEDVKISGFTKNGCEISGNSSFCKIMNSDFVDNETAIYLNTGRVVDDMPNKVSQNSIRKGNRGVVCKNASGAYLVNNRITGTKEEAIQVSGNNVHITDNFITKTGNKGVVLKGSKINFKGNTLIDLTGVSLDIEDSKYITIFANTFAENNKESIRLRASSSIAISGNKFHGTLIGISESDDCAENIFLGNTISDYSRTGIIARGSDSINKNNLIDR